MPVPSPFHERTAPLCSSGLWKDWAGWLAVRSFDDHPEPEYFAVRTACGLLDVTPLFKYRVRGPGAAAFLAWVMTRDIRRLRPGRVAYCTWTDRHGKMLDDGTVMHLGGDQYRVTAADPAFAWLARSARRFPVEIEDETEALAALALQGPRSREVLEHLLQEDPGLRFFGHRRAVLGGVEVEITRTGYTGDLGYEIWIPRERALEVWDRIVEAGRLHALKPFGLDALDVLRVEAGFVMNGVDYWSAEHCLIERQKSTPFELSLDWTVQLDREPFQGQAALRAEKERGPRLRFVGLDIDWEALEALYDEYGLPAALPGRAWRDPRPVYGARRPGRRNQVGRATSGAWSPILKRNLALATLEAAHARPGTRLWFEVTVEYERRLVPCTVVETPFFDPQRKRT